MHNHPRRREEHRMTETETPSPDELDTAEIEQPDETSEETETVEETDQTEETEEGEQ